MKLTRLFFVPALLLSVWAAAATSDPRVEELLSRMTLEEKIGQLNLLASKGNIITGPVKGKDCREDIRLGRCGNVLNASSVEYLRMLQKIAVEESRLGIPLTFGYDEIHGYKTIFPISIAEACTWEPALIEKCARAGAAEAAADGINITYNPMVDIALDPRWGRISEGAGEDPYLGSLIAAARVRGVQGDDLSDIYTLAACLKHYAGYGAPEGGRDYAAVEMGDRRFREFYLPPYKAAVEAGVRCVMTSFNLYDGVPATANHFLMRTLLRGEMGFDGLVMTDYGSIKEMLAHGVAANLGEASKMALEATTDMDMMSKAYVATLKELVESGKVDVKLVDDACRRVLKLKFDLGLMDDPYRYLDPMRLGKLAYSKEHMALAKEEAVKSMVLLKNEGKILPLRKGMKIALVGDLCDKRVRDYCGAWAGACEPEKTQSILDRFSRDHNLVASEKADVIVCVLGEGCKMSGEAASKTDIRLPEGERELFSKMCALGKPVVLVALAGRPLDLSDESARSQAILMAWQPGTTTADALHDILYGVANPSGRLTASFPRNVGQVPVYHYMQNTGRPHTDGTGVRFHSRYLDCWNAPLYPFGYGLSYTEFKYSEPSIDGSEMNVNGKLTVSATITNTGERAGDEVVQLYLRDMVGSVSRPVKMLRGFEKISLKPGESRTVSFEITGDMLKFWRRDMTYGSEPGEFRAFIGPDASIDKYVTFNLK